MRRSSLARACYILLLACFPASMLLVVWVSPETQDWLLEHAHGLHKWMTVHFYPFLSSWPQYFAVQTLASMLLVCGAAWVLSLKVLPPLRRGFWLFPALVGAYAAWAGLSYFWSEWPYGTRAYFVRELPFYFLCVAAYLLCGRPRRWTTVARVFAVSAVAEAALQTMLIINRYRSGSVEPLEGRALTLGYVFLKHAIFYSNQNFGMALVLTGGILTLALLALRLLPAARAEGEGPPAGSRLALMLTAAAFALCALGFIFVTGRSLAGAVAAVTAAVAYLLCLLPRRKRIVLGVTIAVVGLAGVVCVLASDRLWVSTMRALLSPHRTTHLRVIDWLTAKELYVRKPLQGWGMGTFPATHARFFPPLARKLPFLKDVQTTHPHNEFARIAAEQGSVGLLLYLALLAYAFATSFGALQRQPLRTRLIGYALLAGTLTFTVQSAFGKAPMNWSFSTNYWILLGVLASAGHWGDERKAEDGNACVHLAPAAAIALAVVVGAVGWYWWEWALGGYRSMVTFNRAYVAQRHLHEEEGRGERFERFRAHVDASRPRFLWPDEVLNVDYVAGWFLFSQHQWGLAARQLEEVQRTVPEFQKTRLFLAECYRNLGRQAEARAQLAEYIARNPYDLGAYDALARIDRTAAVQALEVHVLSRLSRPPDWIVEDWPSPDEFKKLLNLYILTDRPEAARELVRRTKRFFTDELQRSPFNVDNQVRALATFYRTKDRDELAEKLRAAAPEAWAGT